MTDQLSIFISHKHEDELAASGIKDILKNFDDENSEKLKFFLSEEIPGGANWYQWIKSRLVESNLLLLLFTDVTKSWDWCLYEAGLFDRLDDNHHRRVICLHSSTATPPDPLQHLQAFPALPGKLRTFVEQLFVKTDLTQLEEPIAPWLAKAPEQVEGAAQEIASLIDRKPVQTNYFSRYVFIHVKEPEKIQRGEIPGDAPIISNGKTLELFDRAPTEGLTWDKLEANARASEDDRWVDELAEAVYVASKGNLPKAAHGLFYSQRGEKVYRPSLYRVDELADGSMIFKVLFEEDISWRLDDVPKYHAALLTSLVMATRFKYELLEKYRGELEGLAGEEADSAFGSIRKTIRNIESEAAARGLMDQKSLVKVFKKHDQEKIRGMYKQWDVVRSAVLTALDDHDAAALEGQLEALSSMNHEYLTLASERYHHIMATPL